MSIARVNHFVAQPDKIEDLHEFLAEICYEIRSAPGNLSADLLQKEDVPTEFLVIERWISKEAHANSARAIPEDKLQKAKSLLATTPDGSFYNDFNLDLSEQDYL
ncbi:antibiotic biosynthesis monooxygenase [Bdellovibrio sp. SKB1291214]|uniref:putative quinol monooxygenase n=1 Tax=Bdellovibrio sp. SKB1291214 TaxID=1732569 RepID=UPI000B51DECD|nr:antibiotic biosynthesis monooxygenase family protein [Bdellovibrio sp. SKB1291214]UYL08377.1 antibiotic biosynthesis monooxygenase [Bdellovibrio sp. SKB1291214]